MAQHGSQDALRGYTLPASLSSQATISAFQAQLRPAKWLRPRPSSAPVPRDGLKESEEMYSSERLEAAPWQWTRGSVATLAGVAVAAATAGGHRARRRRARALGLPGARGRLCWLERLSRHWPLARKAAAEEEVAGSRPSRHEDQQRGLLVSRRSILVTLLAASLSLLGFTMPSPILPDLRDQFSLTANEVGMVSSSFAAGMTIAVMVLPAVSDTQGRRPTAIGALVSTALGFFAQGLVLRWNMGFSSFLVARFLTGLFAGCNPIFKAYLADVVPSALLASFMVYREAAATVAFIVGPTLGGYLASGPLSTSAPLFATALAHLLAAFALWACMEESIDLRGSSNSSSDRAGTLKEETPSAPTSQEKTSWNMVLLSFGLSMLYVVGQSCFSSFFALLVKDRFGATPRGIGVISTAFACLALFFQLLLYRPLLRRFGLPSTGFLGALALAAGLAGLGAPSWPLWLSAACYALGVALFPATIPTLLARAVPRTRRGVALGAESIVNNICRVVSPMFLATLYSQRPGLAFEASGVLMLVVATALAILRLSSKAPRSRSSPSRRQEPRHVPP